MTKQVLQGRYKHLHHIEIPSTWKNMIGAKKGTEKVSSPSCKASGVAASVTVLPGVFGQVQCTRLTLSQSSRVDNFIL